jgi:alpha-ketoglutaric semialdehyde dehydrogenase
MPVGIVQLLYRTSHSVGQQLVTDDRVGATGYTGSRGAGLALKQAADNAGKPIYLELSSVNPVVFLPNALEEKCDALAEEFAGSCLMGTGQFCTNPGMVLLIDGEASERFIEDVKQRFEGAPVGTLLSDSVKKSLHESHRILKRRRGRGSLRHRCGYR